MAGKETLSLRETLLTQQKLLHKIYAELEAEREASSTAASEALSMILRLQAEKAAVKLEASQFKRMTQEKMNHAEELMLLFEDLMQQKEMEITSLEFQVQAYRYKLLSMGVRDYEIGDMESEDTRFMSQNEDYSGDLPGPVRRIQSLPAIQYKGLPFKKDILYREISDIEVEETSSTCEFGENHDYEFDVQWKDVRRKSEEPATGDLISYWEQIKELDERVEQLSRGHFQGVECDRVSSDKRLQSSELEYQRTFSCSSSQTFHSAFPCLETEDVGSTSQSMRIHDVFEVPQSTSSDKLCQPQAREGKMLVLEEENRLGKPDTTPHDIVKYYPKDDDYVKSLLKCADNENKWTKPREGISVNCHLALVDLTKGMFPFQTDYQQLHKRLEMLEDERSIVKQGVSGCDGENSRLLKEIHEQLNSIRFEIRRKEPESYPVADEASLVSLMEAMFFYSL